MCLCPLQGLWFELERVALISASFRDELALGLLDFLQKTSRKVPYSVGREQPAELRNLRPHREVELWELEEEESMALWPGPDPR